MQKAFKKWMKATAILFAVMLIGANTGLAQVTISLGEITGRPGESATVAVNIDGVESGTAIRAFDFTVVSDAGVTFTGVSSANTLSGDAEFSTGVNGGVVGSFSTAPIGTDVTTSGNLINLNFDLDAEGVGAVTLVGFRFNDGIDPTVAGGDPSTAFTVAARIISVAIEHETRIGEPYTNTGQQFKIFVQLEDALVEGDGAVSFDFNLHYDPAFVTINTWTLDGGIADGSLVGGSVVNANDDGAGTILLGGFSQNAITGAGTLVTLWATAGPTAGNPLLSLSDVHFNLPADPPFYAPRSGVALILPFNVANEDETGLPTEFALNGNYPNPFNPSTTIQFDLPESANVSVSVMDLLGRQVLSVPVQSMSAGTNRSVQINANSLSSGIYLYRVIATTRLNTRVKVGTMTLLK